MKRAHDDEPAYRPFNARRRLLIGALAISTAVGITLMLIYRPGGTHGTRHLPADVPTCKPGGAERCVGGKAEVILLSAPRSAAPSSGVPSVGVPSTGVSAAAR